MNDITNDITNDASNGATALCVRLNGEADTLRFGALLRDLAAPATLLFLHGDLGAGKTTLVRGLLRALGHSGAVKSPTYTLVEPYTLDGLQVLHCDLYRLSDPGELDYLGLRDADTADGAPLLIVEWAERAGDELGVPDYRLTLEHAGDARIARLQGSDERRRQRIAGLRRHLRRLPPADTPPPADRNHREMVYGISQDD